MTTKDKWEYVIGLYKENHPYGGDLESILPVRLFKEKIIGEKLKNKLIGLMKISYKLDPQPWEEPYGILYTNLLYSILKK